MRGGGVNGTTVNVLILGAALGGCGVVGPYSIEHGRTSYNDVIHQTSADQLFVNLIRIHNNEMPLFMDVTEVDASVLIQGSVTGGASGIGATKGTTGGTLAGQVSSVAGTGQYQEAPVIRYQPLQGQPLIAQVNSPISADSISSMLQADWNVAPVITLTLDRLTEGYSTYGAAINAIIDLDTYGALTIQGSSVATAKSKAPPTTTTIPGSGETINISVSNQEPTQPSNSALTLFFTSKFLSGAQQYKCDLHKSAPTDYLPLSKAASHLWTRLLRIYQSSSPNLASVIVPDDFDDKIEQKKSTAELETLLATVPASIQLPMRPYPRAAKDPKSTEPPTMVQPLLQPRSALGVLKVVSDEKIAKLARFVSPEQAAEVIRFNQGGCASTYFYIIPHRADVESQAIISNANTTSIFILPDDTNSLSNEFDLQARRTFLLIQMSSSQPFNAFVSTYANGSWYYISNDDAVSKRSFALLSLIATVQAIPNASPGLTPALSIGAK